jgi:hypothetical protein
MWVINDRNLRPLSIGDHQLANEKWTGSTVPAHWKNAALASSRKNQPLEIVVKQLIELSK